MRELKQIKNEALTLLHTGSDCNKRHEGAEGQVSPKQGFIQVASRWVSVVFVHESEGHGGDGVEKEGSAHDCHIPPFILSCTG